jgi:hypothetical protein
MASNVVIDATTISSLSSQVASVQQFLSKGQYYYKGRDYASASVFPYLNSGTIQAMSVFQTTVPITINGAKETLDLVVPPNAFKNKPVVSAVVECSSAPGPMIPILTNIDTSSYAMNFDVHTITSSTFPSGGIPAFVHITAISYE